MSIDPVFSLLPYPQLACGGKKRKTMTTSLKSFRFGKDHKVGLSSSQLASFHRLIFFHFESKHQNCRISLKTAYYQYFGQMILLLAHNGSGNKRFVGAKTL